MPRILGLGDNTVDHYLHQGMMYPGGNALNVAVLGAKYGCKSSYLGWLGNDKRGELILDSLHEEGIDTSHVRVVEGSNSISRVKLVDGERVFGKSDHGVAELIALEPEDYAFIKLHDAVHSSIYSHIENALPEISRAAKQVSFDFSSHASEEYLQQCSPFVDTAFVSIAENPDRQIEEFVKWLYELGPSLVIATRGPLGAIAFDGQAFYRQPIVPTEVVDTLGAGDAFIARVLCERLKGTSIEAALPRAAESAAETCRYYGAFGRGVSVPGEGGE